MPSYPSRDLSSSSTREGWLRDLSVLLRLRGVDRARIGDELAKVETFCDDTGQEPKEAFGEPASYIATLRFVSPRGAWFTAVVTAVRELITDSAGMGRMVWQRLWPRRPLARRADPGR